MTASDMNRVAGLPGSQFSHLALTDHCLRQARPRIRHSISNRSSRSRSLILTVTKQERTAAVAWEFAGHEPANYARQRADTDRPRVCGAAILRSAAIPREVPNLDPSAMQRAETWPPAGNEPVVELVSKLNQRGSATDFKQPSKPNLPGVLGLHQRTATLCPSHPPEAFIFSSESSNSVPGCNALTVNGARMAQRPRPLVVPRGHHVPMVVVGGIPPEGGRMAYEFSPLRPTAHGGCVTGHHASDANAQTAVEGPPAARKVTVSVSYSPAVLQKIVN